MRKLILFVFLICPIFSNATHIRGGEITYEWMGGYIYKFLSVMYIDNSLSAPDSVIELCYGDGTCDTVTLNYTQVNSNVTKSMYYSFHTYPGPGTYTVSFQRPNWLINVLNIDNSVNVNFISTTTLYIDPFSSQNNSPILSSDHWDISINPGAMSHNVMAYDTDGDSLSFSFVPITGTTVPLTYNYPNVVGGGTSYIDPSGVYYFYNLSINGAYAVNFRIEEWKFGILRGFVERQMVFDWVATAVENIEEQEIVFYSQSENEIRINSGEILKSVKAFDIAGKLLFSASDINADALSVPVMADVFIIETTTVNNHISTRKFVGR